MEARTRILMTLTLLGLAAPAAGQQASEQSRTTVHGVVVDALRGDPLPNAIVLLADEHRGMLSDSLGRFSFTGVPLGEQTLAIKQYGYDELDMVVQVVEGQGAVRVELQPGPLALEGFTVLGDHLATMNQRLESRARAWGGSVRAIDQGSLAASGADNALELLANTGALHLQGCGMSGAASSFRPAGIVRSDEGACIFSRGSVIAPRVYIDEAPIMGGLSFLSTFRPYELYKVEVFSGGRQIRAYTHWYMERMAGRPEQLWPLEL